MAGWERIERDWLFAFLDGTPRPWPKHALLMWLRYANAARERGAQIQTPTKSGGWEFQRSLVSGRDLAEAVGLTYKVTRSLIESDGWKDFPEEKDPESAPERAQDGRNEGATRAQDGRSEGAKRQEKAAINADRDTSNGRNEGATRAQDGRSEGADRALARAFPLTPTPTQTPTQTREADRDLTDSPPTAKPSGSLSDGASRPALSSFSEHKPSQLPTAEGKSAGSTVPPLTSEQPTSERAAERAANPSAEQAGSTSVCSKMETTEAIPAWLTEPIGEFQPVSEPYTFEDAHHGDITEQPRIARQIESPAQLFDNVEGLGSRRAPEAPPQGSRPSPTRSQGTGEGATGPAQGALWGSGASGAPLPPPPSPEPAKVPQRPRKERPEPPPLDHPDDPAPLLLGAKVSVDHLTEDLLTVYRSWWRRQASPATCRLTRERFGLIRQALTVCTVDQLVHLVRYAYEAADLGNWHRAWRGESGQSLPELAMLLRGDKFEGNVWRAAQWGVERIEGAPPADPLPANVHPFPMPPPPRPAVRNFQSDRFAILQEMIKENQRNAQQ